MRRLCLHLLMAGTFLGLIAGPLAMQAHSQEIEIPETTQALADTHGLDAIELHGAAITTGLDAYTYLVMIGTIPPPRMSSLALHRVRLTYYNESGLTASGGRTYPGSTACSYNFAFGTRFRFPNGEVFTCNDRGHLGSVGWLDLFRRPDLAIRYGPYVTVEILP